VNTAANKLIQLQLVSRCYFCRYHLNLLTISFNLNRETLLILPPINPNPRPYLRVDFRDTWILTWITWEAVTGVDGYPVKGYNDIRWLTGLWSNQAKVEGITLKAVWHWGSDSKVVNDSFGEPGRTPLYVGLPSAWGSVDCDGLFSPISWEGSLTGDSDRYK
jgi:hypothetical protein